MRLIICEKPSVAAKMAEAVSALTGKRTAVKGRAVKHYEVGDVTIAPAVGHLYGLHQAKPGAGYPIFEIEWAPSFEISKGSEFTEKYWRALKTLAEKADEVVNACDYDLEGSLIGWNLARFLAPGKKLKRMKFSFLTRDELARAYGKMSAPDLNNALAGEARHKLDWIYGINLSRALMASLRAAGTFRVMSIGRVQGPALSIIAERENEIAAFKPEPYWQILAFYPFEGAFVEFLHEQDKFWKKTEADAAFARCNEKGRVDVVARGKVKQNPPFPYDLTTLQLDAYRCFGFAPARTLSIAQSLYEAAVISYPRTSSQKLPVELGLDKIIRSLAGNPQYSALAGKLITAKRFKPSEGKKEDPAHPAVFPTGEKPSKLSLEEAKLYDLITKRFLACFAEPALKESLRVELLLGSERFKATGSTVIEKGWLEFFGEYVEHEDRRLPAFKEGEAVRVDEIKLLEKETTPPKRFTPASIIKELEKRGLGTKATRSQILQTLYDRGYVADQKSITATAFGLAVHNALSKECPEITSEELTREIESELELVQSGEKDAALVFEHGKRDLEKILADFKLKEASVGAKLLEGLKEARKEASVLGACKCGGNLVLRKSRYGLFVGCEKYPACKQVYPLPKGAAIVPLNKACEKCGTPIVNVRRKGKRPFNMCLDTHCETKANWGKKPDENRA
ncbi:MAG: DNA topoisomerase I [Candidatus Micrarchaeia archaeon]